MDLFYGKETSRIPWSAASAQTSSWERSSYARATKWKKLQSKRYGGPYLDLSVTTRAHHGRGPELHDLRNIRKKTYFPSNERNSEEDEYFTSVMTYEETSRITDMIPLDCYKQFDNSVTDNELHRHYSKLSSGRLVQFSKLQTYPLSHDFRSRKRNSFFSFQERRDQPSMEEVSQ